MSIAKTNKLQKSLAILIEEAVFVLIILWLASLYPDRVTTAKTVVMIVAICAAVLASGLSGGFLEKHLDAKGKTRRVIIFGKIIAATICFTIAFFVISIYMPLSNKLLLIEMGLGYSLLYLMVATGTEFLLSLNRKRIRELIEDTFKEEEIDTYDE